VIGHHKVKDVRVEKIWNAHGRDAKHKTSVWEIEVEQIRLKT
jgi:hypothetical protein